MSEHELICAMEYIRGGPPYFLNERNRELARTWNRRALELIEGSEQEKPLGFMMIETSPRRLNWNRSSGWTCGWCFRHNKENDKYCKKHKPGKSAGWRRYWQEQKYAHSEDAPESVKTALECLIDWRNWSNTPAARIHVLTHNRGWMWDIGLYTPQPPVDWKKRVEKWRDAYSEILPALLYEQDSWSGAVAVLRTALEDDYCLCEEFDLWEAKIQARKLEYDFETTLRANPRKRRKRPGVTSRVALLARSPSMTQKKIAERLKISMARVSQIVKNDPRLQHLRRKTGRKSGVNTESN